VILSPGSSIASSVVTIVINQSFVRYGVRTVASRFRISSACGSTACDSTVRAK
jgi:hypothetical protein